MGVGKSQVFWGVTKKVTDKAKPIVQTAVVVVGAIGSLAAIWIKDKVGKGK